MKLFVYNNQTLLPHSQKGFEFQRFDPFDVLNNQTVVLLNAHCHLYNHPNLTELLHDNNRIYISNALDKKELEHHLSIKSPNFLISTGQHPLYTPDTITEDDIVPLLDRDELFAIGEIGFDKRSKDFEWQKNIFVRQVDIANQYQKPVIIHCVGHYYDLHKVIKSNFPKVLFILHGFTESLEIIDKFCELNVVFSFHKDITKVKNAKNIIKEIVSKHSFVFETDIDENNHHDITNTMSHILGY